MRHFRRQDVLLLLAILRARDLKNEIGICDSNSDELKTKTKDQPVLDYNNTGGC